MSMNQVIRRHSLKFIKFRQNEGEALNEDLLCISYRINNSKTKRIIDILFSVFVMMVVFSWLFPLIAILIKITSKGSVFFLQDREGINKQIFKCYKFRTMRADSCDVDASGKYLQASGNDKRITKLGKFLRKTSIDELPQFLNVIKGDMSVVGPRPHPIPLNKESEKYIDGYKLRHLVKPGITGLAQISGLRGETRDIRLMQARIDADINYIKKWGKNTDLKIVYKTVINLLTGDSQAV